MCVNALYRYSLGDFAGSAFKGLDPINPGGPLDFFNVAATPEDLAILKVGLLQAVYTCTAVSARAHHCLRACVHF